MDPVLGEDRLDEVGVELRLRHHRLQVQAPLLLLLEHNVRRGLV